MTENIFDIFDELTWEELASLRKSNVFNREFLRVFNTYKANRMIKEFVPLISLLGVSYAVMNVIKDTLRK